MPGRSGARRRLPRRAQPSRAPPPPPSRAARAAGLFQGGPSTGLLLRGRYGALWADFSRIAPPTVLGPWRRWSGRRRRLEVAKTVSALGRGCDLPTLDPPLRRSPQIHPRTPSSQSPRAGPPAPRGTLAPAVERSARHCRIVRRARAPDGPAPTVRRRAGSLPGVLLPGGDPPRRPVPYSAELLHCAYGRPPRPPVTGWRAAAPPCSSRRQSRDRMIPALLLPSPDNPTGPAIGSPSPRSPD